MQAYSDPKRESDPYALPDVETLLGDYYRCNSCGRGFAMLGEETECPDCLSADTVCEEQERYFWWSCFPGCLPDGEPNGPFATEAEALADAQEEEE